MFAMPDDVSWVEAAAEAALASAPSRDPRRIGLKGCTSLHLASQPIVMALISLICDWSTIIWLMFFGFDCLVEDL
jgi:hypothetical protein